MFPIVGVSLKNVKATGLDQIINLDPMILDFSWICQSGISLVYKTKEAPGNSHIKCTLASSVKMLFGVNSIKSFYENKFPYEKYCLTNGGTKKCFFEEMVCFFCNFPFLPCLPGTSEFNLKLIYSNLPALLVSISKFAIFLWTWFSFFFFY